jgi:hypothetical protein
LIIKSAPQPAIMNTPIGGAKMVIMIRRICEIMLAVCLVVFVIAWVSAMRRWILSVRTERMDESMEENLDRGTGSHQTLSCVMVNIESRSAGFGLPRRTLNPGSSIRHGLALRRPTKDAFEWSYRRSFIQMHNMHVKTSLAMETLHGDLFLWMSPRLGKYHVVL